jgi:hypothetical protein
MYEEILQLFLCGWISSSIFSAAVTLPLTSASPIHNKSVFIQDDFWFRCRGDINMNTSWTYDYIKEYVNKYWDSHRNASLSVESSSFVPQYKKIEQKAYRASRNCDYCCKYPERKAIKGTHDTVNCHFGDNPGRTKLKQFSNKSGSVSYSSPTFHDSLGAVLQSISLRTVQQTLFTALVVLDLVIWN